MEKIALDLSDEEGRRAISAKLGGAYVDLDAISIAPDAWRLPVWVDMGTAPDPQGRKRRWRRLYGKSLLSITDPGEIQLVDEERINRYELNDVLLDAASLEMTLSPGGSIHVALGDGTKVFWTDAPAPTHYMNVRRFCIGEISTDALHELETFSEELG